MQKMNCGFLVACALGLLLAATACGTKTVTITKDYHVSEGQVLTIPVDLEKDDLLEVSVKVQGESGDDIGVRVEDPSGRQLVPLEIVQSREFVVTAQEGGMHAVMLDNSHSNLVGKFLTLEFVS